MWRKQRLSLTLIFFRFGFVVLAVVARPFASAIWTDRYETAVLVIGKNSAFFFEAADIANHEKKNTFNYEAGKPQSLKDTPKRREAQ